MGSPAEKPITPTSTVEASAAAPARLTRLRVRRQAASVARGFTLIEILVVLVIIGIGIALVSVNFRRDAKSELREEAQRLALLLQAARSEAINTGKPLAWIAMPPNYGFYRRDADRRWSVAIDDPPFTRGTLPAQISLADLQINRAQMPVATPLVFSASGLNTPFRLQLESAGERMLVIGDAAGNIRSGEAPAAGG